MQVLDIFPIPIIYNNIADVIDKNLLDELLSMSESEKLIMNSGKNYYTQNRNLLTTNFKNSKLSLAVQKNLDFFIKEIYNEKTANIRITQSWLNFNPPGTNHPPHNHTNSIVSGVIYLKVNDKTGDFKFYRPHTQQRMVLGPLENINPYNSEYCRFTPNFGDIFLFSSSLGHGVDINESNITRVSLAFNSFYTGELLHTDLSELIL